MHAMAIAYTTSHNGFLLHMFKYLSADKRVFIHFPPPWLLSSIDSHQKQIEGVVRSISIGSLFCLQINSNPSTKLLTSEDMHILLLTTKDTHFVLLQTKQRQKPDCYASNQILVYDSKALNNNNNNSNEALKGRYCTMLIEHTSVSQCLATLGNNKLNNFRLNNIEKLCHNLDSSSSNTLSWVDCLCSLMLSQGRFLNNYIM